jgi:hypothetical protein
MSIPDEVELAFKRYDCIMRYLAYENTVYWTRVQFFAFANAGLFAFVVAQLPLSDANSSKASSVLVICFAGFILSCLWRLTLFAAERWINRWTKILVELEPLAFDTIKVWRGSGEGFRSKEKVSFISVKWLANCASWLFILLWSLAIFHLLTHLPSHQTSLQQLQD